MATSERRYISDRAGLAARWARLNEDDLAAILADAEQLAVRLRERYGLSAEDAEQQAEEFMKAAQDRLVGAYHEVADAVEAAAERIDRVVTENSWAAVGAAFLVGGVVGYLIGTERRRSRYF